MKINKISTQVNWKSEIIKIFYKENITLVPYIKVVNIIAVFIVEFSE